jgi:hypothetical protein
MVEEEVEQVGLQQDLVDRGEVEEEVLKVQLLQ